MSWSDFIAIVYKGIDGVTKAEHIIIRSFANSEARGWALIRIYRIGVGVGHL